MDKIKEVIRYGVTTELSERAIGRALKVSRTAVTNIDSGRRQADEQRNTPPVDKPAK